MVVIASLHARQILDSRGEPTVEVDCELSDGTRGRAAVPAGASVGRHEAVELRDRDPTVYWGRSVFHVLEHVRGEVTSALEGKGIADQRTIDQILIDLDGTPKKSRLGANTLLGVSMALCRARAAAERRPLFLSLAEQYEVPDPHLLPLPLLNVLNGGKHADSGLSIQEFMLVPTKFDSFSDALQAGAETYRALKGILRDRKEVTAVGDEGGFAPRFQRNAEACAVLAEAIEQAGYSGRIQFALDVAATEFLRDGAYILEGRRMNAGELLHFYEELGSDFPIVSLEDPFGEEDWEGFVALTERLGARVQIVGDDLFTTNVDRIHQGVERKAANAVLIKLNQIGTVSETVDAIRHTQAAGWRAIVSHRSGETEDTFIAHLAVALRAGQIKAGAPCRSERTCKYNALLRIEEELGKAAEFQHPFG